MYFQESESHLFLCSKLSTMVWSRTQGQAHSPLLWSNATEAHVHLQQCFGRKSFPRIIFPRPWSPELCLYTEPLPTAKPTLQVLGKDGFQQDYPQNFLSPRDCLYLEIYQFFLKKKKKSKHQWDYSNWTPDSIDTALRHSQGSYLLREGNLNELFTYTMMNMTTSLAKEKDRWQDTPLVRFSMTYSIKQRQ